MSKRANLTAIGAFVLGGITLGLGAVAFFGSGAFFQQTTTFLMYFTESVNGLQVGAPVKFKGVDIGSVTDIRIQYNQPANTDAIPVFVQINQDQLKNRLGVTNLDLSDPEDLRTQIRLGLRARMQALSYVTGMLFIELDYYSDTQPQFFQQEEVYLEIPTVSSNTQEIMRVVSETLADINNVDFGGISDELKGSLRELRRGLRSLDFAQFNDHMISAASGLDAFVNSDEFRNSMKNVEGITEEVLGITRQFKQDFVPLSQQMRDSLGTVEDAMLEVQRTLQPESSLRVQLETTLREFSRAARTMQLLAEYLERHPNAVITGKPETEE